MISQWTQWNVKSVELRVLDSVGLRSCVDVQQLSNASAQATGETSWEAPKEQVGFSGRCLQHTSNTSMFIQFIQFIQ